MARTTKSSRPKKAASSAGGPARSRVVQQFIKDIRAYCALIENHEKHERNEFLLRCGVLLPRLYSNLLQLPEGRCSQAIFERRWKIYKVLHMGVDQIISDMTFQTNWKGPIPKPWDPIARDWMRSVHLDEERIAPVKSDPYYHTRIPYGVRDRLWEALQAYLGDVEEYWEIFCPYHRKQPLGCLLSDDLMDIWGDVKEGLLVHDNGSDRARQHAIWMWQFYGFSHWGSHVVGALRPIEWILSDAYNDPD